MTSVLNPDYLNFCGRKLIDLYKLETEEIYDFLESVCTTKTLIIFYKQFLSLCPLDKKVPACWEAKLEHNFKPVKSNGKVDNSYDPPQHIYRTITEEWQPIFKQKGKVPDEVYDKISKFDVNLNGTWKHTTPDSLRASSFALDGGVFYWNHYDLLGLILSLLKEDLEGATKDNFFLPLTAVYGRWCAKIGGNGKTANHPKPSKPPKDGGITAKADKPKGVGAVPTVFQCTWMRDTKGVYFALGCSLAGYDWNAKTQVGAKWKERLRTSRFDLLHDWNHIHTLTRKYTYKGEEKEDAWHFNNSPNRSKNIDKAGTHFGNCGETYPFLHIFRSLNKDSRKDVNGLALQSYFLQNEVLQKEYSPLEIHKKSYSGPGCLYLIPPCDNCEYLIQVADGEREHFVYSPVENSTGSKDVPPR